MKEKLYFVEVGVLILPNNEEFYNYTIPNIYDNEFGFYDENRLAFLSYKEALDFLNNYVNNGIFMTYGMMWDSMENLTDEQKQEIIDFNSFDYITMPYKIDDILIFKYKNKSNTIINRRCE